MQFAKVLPVAVLVAMLGGHANGASTMDDNFDGSSIDTCRWEELSYQGTASQAGELLVSTLGNGIYNQARILSQSRLIGDFDVQVDYRRLAGFDAALPPPPAPLAQLNIAMALYWDEARFIQLFRSRNSAEDAVRVFATSSGQPPVSLPGVPATGNAGTLRIVRSGAQITFYHSSGSGWTHVGSLVGPTEPAFVYLSAVNVGVARSVTAAFDRFVVNSGQSDDVQWVQPGFYSKRPGFALGGVSENWPAFRYFGNVYGAFDPIATFRSNGMEWMRVGVTTISRPELDAIAPEHWKTLVWRDDYWGSREYAARTLRDAADRGMRLYAYLYFSDSAAHWGNQTAPAAWAGKSIAETAALMDQHAYETAMYFKSRGLNVEIYELGNETDIGMVDFLPLRRIPVPAGVDFVNDRTWLRNNVWSVQAILLKGAIAGIRRADPAARVAVHAASLQSGTGSQMGPDFYRAMRDFGVDYDIAAISNPYAQGPTAWGLHRYSKACWFKRAARTIDKIAVPGKPVMVVEASYQASPDTLVSPPMPDFPFSPQGQADWAREQFRFASNHPSVVGWFWFYPEFWANITSSADPAYVLQFGSLLSSGNQTRPALEEFRVNLQDPSANTVEYFHAGFGHWFMTADPNEIAALDGGAFGGAWQRTGRSFMSHQNPTAGTVPVCRFFSTTFAPKSSHFYTADAVECAGLQSNPNWQFEKIAFHVPLPDAAGNCPAGSQAVFRMYNNGQTGAPNHRFTTDPAIRHDFLANRGFAQEGEGPLGVSMCAPY